MHSSSSQAQARSESGPLAQSPVFFTDKMIVWDAAAPVNQDLSVSIDGTPPRTHLHNRLTRHLLTFLSLSLCVV